MDAEFGMDWEKQKWVLMGKPNGMKPLGRTTYGRKNNIKIDLKIDEGRDLDWSHMIEERGRIWRTR
jgi:hypothetical protein